MFYVIVKRITEKTASRIEDLTQKELQELRFGTPLLFMNHTGLMLTDKDFGDEIVCINLDTLQQDKFIRVESATSINHYRKFCEQNRRSLNDIDIL